jgi:23S rRNA (adenine2503-C2)-methyltransferase
MCDAGGDYRGRLSAGELLAQTDFMVRRRYPDGRVPARKFKVQFARVGEPSMNPEVLEALEALANRYDAPGLVACVSTVAPSGSGAFFHGLLEVKERHYTGGKFQLQFSVHSTDPRERDRLMPVSKWGLGEIARFGDAWFRPGDRKITLNFAPATVTTIDTKVIAQTFDPGKFLVKFTPLNPTRASASRGMHSLIEGGDTRSVEPLAQGLRDEGFEVLVSVGDLEENRIGSNCGMYLGAPQGSDGHPNE